MQTHAAPDPQIAPLTPEHTVQIEKAFDPEYARVVARRRDPDAALLRSPRPPDCAWNFKPDCMLLIMPDRPRAARLKSGFQNAHRRGCLLARRIDCPASGPEPAIRTAASLLRQKNSLLGCAGNSLRKCSVRPEKLHSKRWSIPVIRREFPAKRRFAGNFRGGDGFAGDCPHHQVVPAN